MARKPVNSVSKPVPTSPPGSAITYDNRVAKVGGSMLPVANIIKNEVTSTTTSTRPGPGKKMSSEC